MSFAKILLWMVVQLSEAIIVALITAGLSLVGIVWTNRKSNAVLMAKIEEQSKLSDANLEKGLAVTNTEIKNLTAAVNRHNNFAERIPALEEKAKAADRRLTELEHAKGA